MSDNILSSPQPSTDDIARLLDLFDSSDDANTVIQRVHAGGAAKYRLTKGNKQRELSHKIDEAQRSGDRNLLKSEKKKVDNHASAVASRVKQAYLIASFEKLVHEEKTQSARLAEALRQSSEEVVAKDAQIRTLSHQVSVLNKERANLAAQLAMDNSCRIPPHFSSKGTWNSMPDNNVNSNDPNTAAHTSYPTFGDLNSPNVNFVLFPNDEQDLRVPNVRTSADTSLTPFLDETDGHHHVSDPHKLESVPWDVIQAENSRRQASFRENYKEDSNNNLFDPAA